MSAENTLRRGIDCPYDYREPMDAAHRAALGVLAELGDRGGLDHELESLDTETRVEIVEALAEIIRAAGLRGA